MNIQTWKTGLSSRQDEEGKGIHESSDEFHEWKIKSWKWWKEHTKERNEKREWAFEERCENQKAHGIPDVSEKKRESQKYWKGPRRQYSKKNEDNTGRNDRKRGQNENEVSGGKKANGKTVRPGTNKILRISPRWERQCEQIDKRRKKGQSKYDRPTEDRLANTSRTEDWFTESL